MKKEENRKTACEAKQEENFSLCGNSGNQSLSAENAGEEKSNAGEKKRDADGIKGDTSEKKRKNGYFSRGEAILWIVSVCVITVAFAFSPEKSWGVFSPFRPYLTWRGQPIPTSSTWHPHKQNSLNFS